MSSGNQFPELTIIVSLFYDLDGLGNAVLCTFHDVKTGGKSDERNDRAILLSDFAEIFNAIYAVNLDLAMIALGGYNDVVA